MKFKKEITIALIIHILILIIILINLFSGKLVTTFSILYLLSQISSIIIGAFILKQINASMIVKLLWFILLFGFAGLGLAFLIITNQKINHNESSCRNLI